MEKLNYSNHKLESISQLETYKKQLGEVIFFKFLDRVYGRLMKMDVGAKIDFTTYGAINVKNRDLFIKTVDLFISEGNHDYRFNENTTEITRYPQVDKIKREEEIKYVKNIYVLLEVKRSKLKSE